MRFAPGTPKPSLVLLSCSPASRARGLPPTVPPHRLARRRWRGRRRRSRGAVFLDSGASPAGGGGPLQRRAELEALEKEVRDAETNRDRARASEESTVKELAAAEATLANAGQAAEQARRTELEAGAEKGEADRGLIHARRQAEEAAAHVD